jgi:hypothetical protein
MAGHRRLGALARSVAPALALAIAGCGDGGSTATGPSAAPTLSGANPVVAVGTAGVKPFVDPPCPAPRTIADRSDPAVTRAADQITELGEKRYAGSYAGVVPCIPAGRIVVYRLPRANSAFARAAGTIAKRQRVDLEFADALFSYRQAQATKKAVLGEFARLDDAGATFAVLNVHENGTVEVAVRANVEAAEKVLSALLDRIYVVLIPEESPSPEP